MKEVPIDWEALEDAFENNAPEVHSYLHLVSGEVLRVVDGIADPEMHTRITTDANYLRVESVSSREQYRWMERFILMIEEAPFRSALGEAIDGKGAFRRFKDVLMSHAHDRERWFAFRSERLRVFMEAWLSAHAIVAVARPEWAKGGDPTEGSDPSAAIASADGAAAPKSTPTNDDVRFDSARPAAKERTPESLRRHLQQIACGLSLPDLDRVLVFAEFIQARRTARVESGESSVVTNEVPDTRSMTRESATSSEAPKVKLVQ